MRIFRYLAHHHEIKISDADVHRILLCNGLSPLPVGTRVRRIHTTLESKQVLDHHIDADVKFQTFIEEDGQSVRRLHFTAIGAANISGRT
jgi:hypothetical protein